MNEEALYQFPARALLITYYLIKPIVAAALLGFGLAYQSSNSSVIPGLIRVISYSLESVLPTGPVSFLRK